MIKKIFLLVITTGLLPAFGASDVCVGDTYVTVTNKMGKPGGSMSAGHKKVLKYNNITVTLISNRVDNIQVKTPQNQQKKKNTTPSVEKKEKAEFLLFSSYLKKEERKLQGFKSERRDVSKRLSQSSNELHEKRLELAKYQANATASQDTVRHDQELGYCKFKEHYNPYNDLINNESESVQELLDQIKNYNDRLEELDLKIKKASSQIITHKAFLAQYERKKAKRGDARAQYNLGNECYSGAGLLKNRRDAVMCYRKSANQGYVHSQLRLGLCYYFGEGVSQDYKEAAGWYRKAAGQGLAIAQKNLGDCYYHGEGVLQDYKEAVKWYRKAAEQGEPNAQSRLGLCYHHGEGVPQDHIEAYAWAQLASLNGDPEAIELLDIELTYSQTVKGLVRAKELTEKLGL